MRLLNVPSVIISIYIYIGSSNVYQRVMQRNAHSAIEYHKWAKKKFNKKAKSIQSCLYLIRGVVVFFFFFSFPFSFSFSFILSLSVIAVSLYVAHLARLVFAISFDLLYFTLAFSIRWIRADWCIVVAGSSNSMHWSLLMQLKWTMSYATNANAFECNEIQVALLSIELSVQLSVHATSSTHYIQVAVFLLHGFLVCSSVCIYTWLCIYINMQPNT